MVKLTTRQCAEKYNVKHTAIRQAIHRKQLKAQQEYGRNWITREEFERWMRARRPVGRPRKST